MFVSEFSPLLIAVCCLVLYRLESLCHYNNSEIHFSVDGCVLIGLTRLGLRVGFRPHETRPETKTAPSANTGSYYTKSAKKRQNRWDGCHSSGEGRKFSLWHWGASYVSAWFILCQVAVKGQLYPPCILTTGGWLISTPVYKQGIIQVFSVDLHMSIILS